MAAPPPAGRPAGGGNILTQKMGPLSTWVWLLIVTVIVGGIALYLRHKAGTSSTSTTTGQATPGQTAGVQDVPDIILQNYNQTPGGTTTATTTATTPPVTPPSTPTGTIGAGGTPATQGIHEYTGNGKLTLAQVAKQHNTTPAKIIAATKSNKNNISKGLSAYLSAGNFNKPIPKGDTIIYTNG